MLMRLSDQAKSAVGELLGSDEDALFTELGARVQAINTDASLAADFGLDAIPLEGAKEVLRDIGRRLFKRWNAEAYKLVCGVSTDDALAREEIAKSVGLGGVALGATIAGALVSSFGLAPAIAAVVGALVVKRFLQPTQEELCAIWKENL
jgi:hypothetical protein